MTVEPFAIVAPQRFAGLPAGVTIEVEPFVAQLNVRGSGGGPAPRGRWVTVDDTTVIRLGPDEWLVTSTSVPPAELEARLSGSVVDVSAQRTTLLLRGPHARDLLASGCALDLDPRSFPPGSAAQTTLGRAGVVLLALDEGFRILVRSSFARYLADWLVDAAAEFAS